MPAVANVIFEPGLDNNNFAYDRACLHPSESHQRVCGQNMPPLRWPS